MHLSLDVFRTADGRLEGAVITESGRQQPFFGTLDLLRILEDLFLGPAGDEQQSRPSGSA